MVGYVTCITQVVISKYLDGTELYLSKVIRAIKSDFITERRRHFQTDHQVMMGMKFIYKQYVQCSCDKMSTANMAPSLPNIEGSRCDSDLGLASCGPSLWRDTTDLIKGS